MAGSAGFPLNIDSSKLNNVNTADFQTLFSAPLFLGDDRWELALEKALIWYSFYNIDPQYNNTYARYSPDNGVTWKDLNIIPGQYSIDQLNDRIHSIMLTNGDYTTSVSGNIFDINILADFSTLKVEITISNNYQLDLTASNLNLLLGFNSIIVTSSQFGANVANINNDINSLKISCDIITSSYDSSSNSNILYVFSPTISNSTGPGSQIFVIPNNLIFIPVIPSRTISSIRIRIVDNLDRAINLHNQPTTYWLYLRKVPKLIS